jgi:hypothetical protein
MVNNKRVKVVGGIHEKHEEGDGPKKKSWHIFTEKKSVVVEERHLAALFRRDFYLCSLPVVKVIPTQERVTPGFVFSDLPPR